MTPTLLLLLLLSADAPGSQGATGCWTACQRNVTDQALRARVCRACITSGRADGWLQALVPQAQEPAARAALALALRDPSWRVRWGALRVRAQAERLPEARVLADWVSDAPARQEAVVCVTAARAAASAGRSTAAFLEGAGARGPAAAARVWARREDVRRELELEVYGEQGVARGEALWHLATFLGEPVPRVLLRAMASRPESADAAPAAALLWVADKQHTSVGRLLVDGARPADQPLINRLFRIYSQELEALQPGLSAPDAAARRVAVGALRLYGPLARRELERALLDEDRTLRQLAAYALAESEGLAPLEAARQRLRAGAPPESASPRAWWELVSVDKDCAPVLLELARDARLSPTARGEAMAWLSECEGLGRVPPGELSAFLTAPQPPVRAGAVRALVRSRSAQAESALAAALEDPAPEVLIAALHVVGERRQKEHAGDVVALLGAASPEVRVAALRTLERLGRAGDVNTLARVLQEDREAPVRVAAAEVLASLGGPLAASALSRALADPDSHVQHVARRGLARLGFTPLPRTSPEDE